MHIHYLTALKITMIEMANTMTAAGHLIIYHRQILSDNTTVDGGDTVWSVSLSYTPLTGIRLAQSLDNDHAPSLNSLPSLRELSEVQQVFSA